MRINILTQLEFGGIFGMTREHTIFYVGLKKLDYYDELKSQRNLSYREMKEIDTIKAFLFGTVRSYGIDLARK